MRTALDVHRELLARDVPHEVVRLRRRLATADDLPAALDLTTALDLTAGCVAVRLYRVTRQDADAAWAAVLVPAGAVPDPAALLDALQAAAVRPATAAETNTVTGFANGLVSPVCLPADVEVLADSALGCSDVVYTAAGEASLALGIRLRDLLVATGARAATLTSAPAVPEPRFADIIDLGTGGSGGSGTDLRGRDARGALDGPAEAAPARRLGPAAD